MASVRKIAEEAGVSISTVSRALNNDSAVNPDTRARVLAIANRFGYVPTIGRRVTTNIAFAYTAESTLADAFDAAVLHGVVRGLDECRFDVVILNLQRDKEQDETYTQFFMRKGVRGVVLRTTAKTRDVCGAIAREGFPHVVISERFDSPDTNYIDYDSMADSTRAIEYLIALGHQRIAFATHTVTDRDHIDRMAGYKSALDNHNLPFDERLVFRQKISLAGGATVMKLAQSMIDPPTAIYFADPLLAVGAVNKAQQLGVRVPDDMSIIGFDDSNMRHSVYPTLTAVCQDAGALGYEAGRWLSRTVKGQDTGGLQKTTRTFLEINQSTAPPAGSRRVAASSPVDADAPTAAALDS